MTGSSEDNAIVDLGDCPDAVRSHVEALTSEIETLREEIAARDRRIRKLRRRTSRLDALLQAAASAPADAPAEAGAPVQPAAPEDTALDVPMPVLKRIYALAKGRSAPAGEAA
jgi:predicted RNA-binding Zn ribbon-like protein